MVTPELLNYVQEQLKQNPNTELVKAQLVNGGWAVGDVEAAIAQVESTSQDITPTQGALAMDKPKRGVGGLIVAIIVLALAGGGYYYWQNRSVNGVKNDSAFNTAAPASWQTYSSISGSPGYTIKYSPDWEVKEKKDLTMFKVTDDITMTVIRQNNSTTFSKMYESAEQPDPSGNVKLVKKSNFTLNGHQAQRYELFLGVNDPEGSYVINTEVLAGTTRWSVDLNVIKSGSDNKDKLDKYKEAYLQVVSSFQPQ